MRKTLNGKSSRCVVSKERNCHRLKAVSDYSFCEVRPGVGPVRKKDNIIAGSGITHVTCTERGIRVIELYSLKRVEPRIYFVSCVKQETEFFCTKAYRTGGKLIKRRDHRWASYHMSMKKFR